MAKHLEGVDPQISGTDRVESYLDHFPMHDPLTVLAALPYYWNKYIGPRSKKFDLAGTTHHIVGLDAEKDWRIRTKGTMHSIGLAHVAAFEHSFTEKSTPRNPKIYPGKEKEMEEALRNIGWITDED